MTRSSRPWRAPVYIYPLSKNDPLYGFGFRHDVLYPDGKRGAAETIEGARKLATTWERTHATT